MRHKPIRFLSCLLVLGMTSLVWADDPTSQFVSLAPIPSSLTPSSTGVAVQFEVWDQASGGTMIFAEAHTVDTRDDSTIANDTGFADLLLGRPTGLNPANFPAGSSRYLDVTVDGTSQLSARIPVYATPFSLNPGPQGPKGDKGDMGAPGPPGVVQTVTNADSSISVTGTPQDRTVAVANGGITNAHINNGALSPAKIAGTAATLGANTFSGTQVLNAGEVVDGGVTGRSSSAIGVWGESTGTSAGADGVHGVAHGPASGVAGVNTDARGVGVWGQNTAVSGTGVYGTSISGTGVYGTSSNNSGVWGYSYGNNGVLGTSSTGVAGVYGAGDGHFGVYSATKLGVGPLGTGGSTNLCRNGLQEIATCASSLRYKTDVQPFLGGLDIVNRLRPIAFTWKQDGMRSIGLAAEEVDKVEPLLTFRNDKGEIEGVKYNELSAVFVNAFVEQQEQIKKQQAQIEALKKLVCLSHPDAELCK